MSLIDEAKKLVRCIRLWREYVDYRQKKKAVSAAAQQRYNGALLL